MNYQVLSVDFSEDFSSKMQQMFVLVNQVEINTFPLKF